MISVVIPLYNKAATIGQAIESVMAQSDVDWELIVVDDGSRDAGAHVVTGYGDPRIRLITQANAGVSAARNAGIAAARAPFVAFLDADDWWAPDHLQALRAASRRHPHPALVATAFLLVEPNGRARPCDLRQALRADDAGPTVIEDLGQEMASFGLPLITSSVMAARDALRAVGGFPLGVRGGEDLLTWLRLSCEGGVVLDPRPSVFYREPPIEGTSHLRAPETPDIVGDGIRALAAHHPQRARGLRAYLAQWLRIRAVLFMQLRQRGPSALALWQAVRLDGGRTRDAVSVALLALPAHVSARLLLRHRERKRARAPQGIPAAPGA